MVTDALTRFLMKNLNSDDWSVYSANMCTITLKAQKDNVLFDETTQCAVVVKKNGHVLGLVEPTTSCVRVVLYLEPQGLDTLVYDILQTRSLKTVKLDKSVVARVLHSYIPDKQKAVRLYQIENEAVLAKKMLTDTLPYEPGIGVEYIKHVSDPDFKERWNIYKM